MRGEHRQPGLCIGGVDQFGVWEGVDHCVDRTGTDDGVRPDVTASDYSVNIEPRGMAVGPSLPVPEADNDRAGNDSGRRGGVVGLAAVSRSAGSSVPPGGHEDLRTMGR